MIWRMTVFFDTDEQGAALAVRMTKAALEADYGNVRSYTVQEWLYQQTLKPPPPFGHDERPEYEHRWHAQRADGHRVL